tara:strand:- start:13733 stop:13981 length:249 start_codon:yes stop_codon:yes gene_type:complete
MITEKSVKKSRDPYFPSSKTVKIPSDPIPIPNSSPKQTLNRAYSSSEELFDPSTSPPENSFMTRLKKRKETYRADGCFGTFS